MKNSQVFYAGKLEVRESENRSGPGTVYGLLVPFDKQATDRREIIQKGALRWNGTVALNRQHARLDPVARASLEAKDDGVYLTAPVPDTQRGRDLITEIKAGLFRGLSVEMHVAGDVVKDGIRYIQDALIAGAGVVTDSAFETFVEARKQDTEPQPFVADSDWWY